MRKVSTRKIFSTVDHWPCQRLLLHAKVPFLAWSSLCYTIILVHFDRMYRRLTVFKTYSRWKICRGDSHCVGFEFRNCTVTVQKIIGRRVTFLVCLLVFRMSCGMNYFVGIRTSFTVQISHSWAHIGPLWVSFGFYARLIPTRLHVAQLKIFFEKFSFHTQHSIGHATICSGIYDLYNIYCTRGVLPITDRYHLQTLLGNLLFLKCRKSRSIDSSRNTIQHSTWWN